MCKKSNKLNFSIGKYCFKTTGEVKNNTFSHRNSDIIICKRKKKRKGSVCILRYLPDILFEEKLNYISVHS